MSQVAKSAGVTTEGLYKPLGENGNPEFATVLRIIAAMGIHLAGRSGAAQAGEEGRRVAVRARAAKIFR